MNSIVRENDYIEIRSVIDASGRQWYTAYSKFKKGEYAADRDINKLEDFFTKRMIEAGFVPKEDKKRKRKIPNGQMSLF